MPWEAQDQVVVPEVQIAGEWMVIPCYSLAFEEVYIHTWGLYEPRDMTAGGTTLERLGFHQKKKKKKQEKHMECFIGILRYPANHPW